jgi:2-polyprenyl-6-methoxyphenol hydroxylase-like FAD-dependent oxidoreductase
MPATRPAQPSAEEQVSLFVGAYVLASELAAASGDHVRGLAAYEQELRPAVHQSQRIGPAGMKALIPRSRIQLWAIAQAIRLLPRLPACSSATHLLRRRSGSHAGRKKRSGRSR